MGTPDERNKPPGVRVIKSKKDAPDDDPERAERVQQELSDAVRERIERAAHAQVNDLVVLHLTAQREEVRAEKRRLLSWVADREAKEKQLDQEIARLRKK